MKTISMALLVVAALLLGPVGTPPASAAATSTARDGRGDFNFLLGTWRTHYRRLSKALSNSHEWYECDGTSIVRPFWGGSGNLEDGDLHCPKQYIGGMTLRLYSASTHQWSLYWGSRKIGLAMPAQVGHFQNGVGDFLANDTWDGKPIIVRFRWTLRSGDHPHFEQAFSTDHGKTWETNWTTDYTRVPSSSKGVWNAAP